MSTDVHALPLRLAACLKHCYFLREWGEPLTAQAVRAQLQTSEPTGHVSSSVVTSLFTQLHLLGYVSHTRYRGVELTETGERAAAELVRHHRLLALFLARVLKVPLELVDAEAEQWAAVLSERVEERIDALLGQPKSDPHGNPIPDPMGRVHLTPLIRLSEAAVGQTVTIQQVRTQDPDLIRYLESLGLRCGEVVYLEARTSYGDVLTLRVGETRASVSVAIADQLQIRVLDEP